MLNITLYWRNANQTAMRYLLTWIRMATIKKSTNNKGWRSVEKREHFYTLGGNANWYNHYGEQCGGSLKNWE